jgi:CheY-like chemotaxis protein
MLSGIRVLVADDDVHLLEVVCEVLTRLDAHVVRAASGGDLIEQLATAGPFDLIVTDVSMPWMSGLQAIRSTRAAGLATPVIVMTALSDPQIPEQVRSLGASAVFLRKPFALSAFEAAASGLVGQASRGASPRQPIGDGASAERTARRGDA